MADINTILKNKGSIKQSKEKKHYEVTMIHYTQIRPSKMQFYSQGDIEEQADSIELADGIMQPLVVRQQDADQYELLAGHRRLEAVKRLVENRKLTQYAMVPCHIEKANDWRAEYLLIMTNSYREKSGYEKMMEVQRLSEILPHLPGSEELKGRALRGRIAKELKTGETSVQNYNYIYNHLCQKGMEVYKAGEIKTAVANELAHLDEEDQKILLRTKGLTSAAIAEFVRNKSCQTLTQKPGSEKVNIHKEPMEENTEQNYNVSNSDTEKDKSDEERTTDDGKEKTTDSKEKESEEDIARKMIARFLEWDPERMQEIITICNQCNTNKERAQKIQSYLSPNGYAGGGDENFDFCFRGYANGLSFELGKEKLTMSYIAFVNYLERVFGPFAMKSSSKQLAESDPKDSDLITHKESKEKAPCEESMLEEPTKEEQLEILQEIIEENRKAIRWMEENRDPPMRQALWKHQLMLEAAENLLNELRK